MIFLFPHAMTQLLKTGEVTYSTTEPNAISKIVSQIVNKFFVSLTYATSITSPASNGQFDGMKKSQQVISELMRLTGDNISYRFVVSRSKSKPIRYRTYNVIVLDNLIELE